MWNVECGMSNPVGCNSGSNLEAGTWLMGKDPFLLF